VKARAPSRLFGAAAGLLCGSGLWAANMQLGLILPDPECRLRLPLLAVGSLAALVVSLVGGFCSWRPWTALGAPRHRPGDLRRPLCLTAALGFGGALLFGFPLALQAAAGFIISGCAR
jgi:hypothetical protein